MILKVFCVLQVFLIQVISAQLSNQDLSIQNVLNHFTNTPQAEYGRSRRQINNPPVGEPGSGDLPKNSFVNGLPLRNGMPFGNLPRGGGLPNTFGLNNELPNNSAFNNELPKSFVFNNVLPNLPFNLPFPSANIVPQNRIVTNVNALNINGLPFNTPNGLPSFNNVPNGLPSFNNVPNALPGLNNVPNGFPGFNNIPNALPGLNNVPNGFPSLKNLPNALPGLNNVPNGLPSLNNIPNAFPGLNNVPNGFPGFNHVPNAFPGLNNVPNGLPSLNNIPNALPGLNNVPNGFPSFKNLPNALPGLNNVANGLPSLNNVPKGLPNINNLPFPTTSLNLNNVPVGQNILNLNNVPAANSLPNYNNVPNTLPSYNNVPNGLPSFNNLPFPNTFLNLNNVPVGKNILNINNVPAAKSSSNMNNMPIFDGLPSLNNLPCGNVLPPLPISNGLALNNLPSGNLLLSIKNQLPYLNNFRITEIGIGNGIADMKRLPRNGFPDGNMLPNYLQSGNGLAQQVADELPNIYNYENGFSTITNTPPASELSNGFSSNDLQFGNAQKPVNNWHYDFIGANMLDNQKEAYSPPPASELSNNMPDSNIFSNNNRFPIGNGASNIASVAQNINNMQLNNDLLDISNFQNYNVMPVSEPRIVNNVPFNNGFADANNFPANTGMPNVNSRLVNAINNGMPLSNGGHLNDILFADNGMEVNMPETYEQNTVGNRSPSNDFRFGNAQDPVNNWHYDFVGANRPDNQNVMPEGVQMFSNVPSDHQSVLMSNNLNLAQELIKNLKIEGNMPFLNGLPVAGITETVTVLNGPYSK